MIISDIIFRNRIAICSLVFLFAMIGCNRSNDGVVRGRRAINAVMDSVESMVNDNPAYADSLIKLIDPYNIKGAKHKARYALLYTMAEYKNYQPLTSDSLIMEAVRYYSIRNNIDYRFLSYYYLGCAYVDMGQMTDASVALVQAEQLADHIDNDYWKGLLYSSLGETLRESLEVTRAEEYFSKAITCFDSAGKDYHSLYALYQIARSRYVMHDFKEADSIFHVVENIAIAHEDSMLNSGCICFRFYCSVYMENKDNARKMYDELKTRPVYNNTDYLLMMSLYFQLIEDYEKAESYLEDTWKGSLSETDSIHVYFVSTLLAEKKGEIKESMTYFKEYVAIQNKSMRRLLNHPIAGAQRDYLRTMAELESIKARNRVTILVASIIICILIISFLIFIILNHRLQSQKEIHDYLSTIDDLTARESVNEGKINLLNSQVKDLLRQQFVSSDYLYTRYYEQIDDNKKAERLFRVVKTQIDQFTSPKSLSRIDELLNKTFDGIMNKLSSTDLELKEKELLLLRFVLTGFSAKSIAALLGDTHININQRKKRLLDKIQNKAPDLMEDLRNALASR